MVYQRSIEAGATSLWPPTDQIYGESHRAGLLYPYGYQWIPATQIKDVRHEVLAHRELLTNFPESG